LGGALTDGVLIRALREEPTHRPVDAVPLAQLLKQDGAENRHALTPTLGMGDPKLQPGGVNIGDLDMLCLGEAESASEDGHKEDAGEGIPFGPHGDQPFDLLDAEHPRRLELAGGALDANEVGLDVLPEHPMVEGADRIDRQVDRGG